MDTIPVNTWEECQDALRQVSGLREGYRLSIKGSYVSSLLYRGQANAEWKLETTLGRQLNNDTVPFDDYYRLILRIKPEIQSYTSKEWTIPALSQSREWAKNVDLFMRTDIPGIEYMIYLRHHGFPSPLLDWTRSPFIAAYFAFQNISKNAQSVSIYAYIENTGQGKSHWGESPLISTIGPYVSTHARHFLQQCEYTICTIKDGEEIFFASHEKVFSEFEPGQDLLWKIDIPSKERFKV